MLAKPDEKIVKGLKEVFPDVKSLPHLDDVSRELWSLVYKYPMAGFDGIGLKTAGMYSDALSVLRAASISDVDGQSLSESIVELSHRERLSAKYMEEAAKLMSGKATPQESAEEVKKAIGILKDDGINVGYGGAVDSAVKQLSQMAESGVELDTGIKELDGLYTFRRKMLTIVAGATSHGKTAFITNLANRAASKKLRTCLFVFEDALTLPFKIASQRYGVPLNFFTRYHASNREERNQADIALSLSRELEPFLSVVQPTTLSALESRLSDMGRVDLIVFDYVQKYVDRYCSEDSKRESIGRVTDDFSRICSKFGAIGVLCSQVRRREMVGKSYVPRRPCLSDLKESGELENYADGVVILWWPWKDRTSEENPLKKEEYHIEVAKDKLGKCGAIKCRFKGETLTFEDFYIA